MRVPPFAGSNSWSTWNWTGPETTLNAKRRFGSYCVTSSVDSTRFPRNLRTSTIREPVATGPDSSRRPSIAPPCHSGRFAGSVMYANTSSTGRFTSVLNSIFANSASFGRRPILLRAEDSARRQVADAVGVVADDARLVDRGGNLVHRRARNPGRAEHGQPLRGRPLGEGGVEDLEQLVAVPVAGGEVGEALVVRELGPAERLAQPLPELLLRTGDDDPAVGRREVLKRHDRRVRRVGPARRDVPARRRPRADVHQLVEGGIEQRDVTVAADAVAARAPEAAEDGDRRRVPTGQVDERQAALRRRPFRVAREAHPAGEALHHVVVAALLRARPGHAEPGQRAAHDARVDVPERVVGEAETRRLVAAQVRVDDVHRAHEVLEDRAGVRVAQVERDRLLVAIEGLEEERALALLERRDIAADVAAG